MMDQRLTVFVDPWLPDRRRILALLSDDVMRNTNLDLCDEIDDATHIITVSQATREIEARCVTPLWLEHSLRRRQPQPAQFYSPMADRLFSGMVVYIGLDIGDRDASVLAGFVEFYGGRYVESLDLTDDENDCDAILITHYVTMSVEHDELLKFDRLIEVQKHLDLGPVCQLILPHYFDDSQKLNRRMDERDYLLPRCSSMGAKPLLERKADPPVPPKLPETPGQMQRFLSADMSFYFDPTYPETTEMIDRYNSPNSRFVVTQYAFGDLYLQARQDGVDSCTLFFIGDILAHRKLTCPRDKLLNYPWRFAPVSGMEKHSISISNYTHHSRDILKLMMTRMGAAYTSSLTPQTTLLICSDHEGPKYEMARKWHLNVVNHTWVEECWKNWEVMEITRPEFVTSVAKNGGMNRIVGMTACLGVPNLEVIEREMAEIESQRLARALPGHDKSQDEIVNDGVLAGIAKKRKAQHHQQQSAAAPEHDTEKVFTKRRRVEKERGPIRVMFTSVKPDPEHWALLPQLGIQTASSPLQATHLICDRVVRTEKLMTALRSVQYVLSMRWIVDSVQNGSVQDEDPYWVVDTAAQTLYGCTIREAVGRAKNTVLFNGMTFVSTSSVVPDAQTLERLVSAHGGKLISGALDVRQLINLPEGTIVLSSEEDSKMWPRFIEAGLSVYQVSFVLFGIMSQQLHFDKHILSAAK